MFYLPQSARSDELPTLSGAIPTTTAIYRPSEQAGVVQPVNWGYRPYYGYYGNRPYYYGYAYPRSYGYSYAYPRSYGYYGYGYGYPRYGYAYPQRYAYGYPGWYGYRF